MQFILASFAVDLMLVFGGLAVFFVDSTAKGFSIMFISQQYLSSGVHFPQTSPSCGLRRSCVNGTSLCWLVAARRRHQVSSALIWFNFLVLVVASQEGLDHYAYREEIQKYRFFSYPLGNPLFIGCCTGHTHIKYPILWSG